MTDVLSNRVLNRTLLQRQHLLERTDVRPEEIIGHLLGLQAQDVPPPFIGLWSRLRDFSPESISDRLEDRSLVRITLMRGTIHLVTAQDALRMQPQFQPELEKIPFRPGFFFGATVGMDMEEVRTTGATFFGDDPVKSSDLRKMAKAAWPDRDASPVVQAIYYLLPLLQAPPRGKWKNNSRPNWAMIEPWLGKPLDFSYSIDDLVLRYLRAFGPASTMDMQTWSKLTGFKGVVERLGSQLRTYKDERGRTLYDVADGTIAGAELPAPVRFLGWYDNVYLSHQDRSRIVASSDTSSNVRGLVNVSPFLVDGFISGAYSVHATQEQAVLHIVLNRDLSPGDRLQLEEEGAKLLTFLEAGKNHDIQIAEAENHG